jgi:HlyD family secretion protein
MRRILLPLVLVPGVLLVFAVTVAFLYWQSLPEEEEVTLVSPAITDLRLETVATGAIVPRVEIEIKSRVSGILAEVSAQPGQQVHAGDLIATIRVVPDAAALQNAQSAVSAADIRLSAAAAELDRVESLAKQAAASRAELDRVRTEHALAQQERNAAASRLRIVRDGAAGGRDVSTDIRSTLEGMVLDVPVEVGASITETNTFSAGTTIALVADMSDMVFEGRVDESEVGRIREGMPIEVTVGALRDARIPGTLEYIAPKGALVDGTVQFQIRAAITPGEGQFVRAGSSANARIVLDERKGVLAVEEGALRFEAGQPYVELASGGTFARRDVKVGLSDGMKIEVLDGLVEGDQVKVEGRKRDPDGPPRRRPGR